MSIRQPEEVFTPRTIVTREMFARRNEPQVNGIPGLQDSLIDALRETGAQLVVYGDTGVGKSSLVRYAVEDESLGIVLANCLSSHKFSDLLDQILRSLIEFEEIERQVELAAEAVGSVQKSFLSLISFSGSLKGGAKKSKKISVVKKPLLDAIILAMRESGKSIICLENFQNLEDKPTISLVAQLMEEFSDRASETGNIKLVVVGIASSPEGLIAGSGSVQRRVSSIGVPRMPDGEISSVLSKGTALLGLSMDPDVLMELVRLSDGFPYFAHSLGLQVSRIARRSGDEHVERVHVDAAIRSIIASIEATFYGRVKGACEVSGATKPRTNLMRILANSSRREWYGSEIVEEWVRCIGPVRQPQFLYVALGQLITNDYGAILTRTGSERSYLYRFSDPYLRPYIRMYFHDLAERGKS